MPCKSFVIMEVLPLVQRVTGETRSAIPVTVPGNLDHIAYAAFGPYYERTSGCCWTYRASIRVRGTVHPVVT